MVSLYGELSKDAPNFKHLQATTEVLASLPRHRLKNVYEDRDEV